MNDDWDEVAPGMYTLNHRGLEKLAKYAEIHGERIRQEFREEVKRVENIHLNHKES